MHLDAEDGRQHDNAQLLHKERTLLGIDFEEARLEVTRRQGLDVAVHDLTPEGRGPVEVDHNLAVEVKRWW